VVDLAAQAAVQAEAAARPSIRRYYVLGLLTVVYALNFLDRTIFNVLIEPIKKEFALSDTTGELIRAAQSRALPFVFIIVLILASDRTARIAVGRATVCDLHHGCSAEERRKTGRMKPFCRNRETILKHTGRTSLANTGRQRRPGGII
jgi:hypothetical protein